MSANVGSTLVRFGLTLFTSDRGITPAAAAAAAERLGFDSFWVPEHTHIPAARETAHPVTGGADLPDDRYMRTLDPWVALAGAAALTTRIRLGTCVALPLEHDPITLAKTVASLDHLSSGRVTLGAGFGWNREEMTDHGVDPAQRRPMLADYVSAMRALWTEETASHDGRFVRFGASWAWPKPAQDPLPVLLGAAGNDRTLEWILRNGDGWISTPAEADLLGFARRLREAWVEAGREGSPAIVALGPRPARSTVAECGAAGVTEILMGLPDRSEAEVIAWMERRAAEVKFLR